MPCAPISFSLPIISQNCFWSSTVCTEHHSFVGQGDDGGTLQAWQHVDDFLQTGLRGVHAYIFLVFGILYGLEAEEHLLQYQALLLAELPVADEQGLAPHHYLHLAQVVAYQCGAAADDVEDAVGESDARTDFHRPRDDVNFCLDAVLVEEVAEYGRIARGNLLAIEPLYALIVDFLGDGQRQTALREAQARDNLGILAALHKFVLAHHADVGHTAGYALRNVVVAEIEHLQGEVT